MIRENLTIYNRSEYFEELARGARLVQEGGRIALATMSFDPTEPLIGTVMTELGDAAQRGADVQLAVDAFSFMSEEGGTGIGPLWLHSTLSEPRREPYRSRFRALEKLSAAGGNYAVVNIPEAPFSIIPAGRSHLKAAVINNRVYLGGCNLRAPEEIDLMVCMEDAELADWVFDLIKSLVAKRTTEAVFSGRDIIHPVDERTTLFADAGVPNQSTILEKALEFIDEAEEFVFITGQYFPGGKTAQKLLTAHQRDRDVSILFSPPEVHGWLASIGHHAYQLRERQRLPASFFSSQLGPHVPKMHAKVIATDKGIMYGSHNYLDIGSRNSHTSERPGTSPGDYG